MAIIPAPSVDYTDRDFDALRLRMQKLVQSAFPEWTDFNVANFGNLLVDLYAFVGDVLGFYQDKQALQSRISTATNREALIGLVKLLGYVPRSATAATADVVITLDEVPAGDVPFPAGTIVSTAEANDPIEYQLLEDAQIDAGANPPTITVSVENSETREERFTSTGLANQALVLSSRPYVDDSAIVTAGDGDYEQVVNFLDSTSADRHFTVVVDQNDRATIRFGNGANGAVPAGTIEVTYKTGGGVAGRVDAGKLTKMDDAVDSLGNAVRVSATNPEKSSGGTDRETVAQIKVNAPATLRVLTRTVALEDYEINALRVPGVSRAMMLTSNQDAGIPENTGILYVVPDGGGAPSQALKDSVLAMVTTVYPRTLTFQVSVQGPNYKSIDVYAVVWFRPGVTKSAVRAEILAALTDFFATTSEDGTANDAIDFGGKIENSAGVVVSELAYSDVLNAVRDVSGIRKVGAGELLLNGASTDVTLATTDFPVLGTLTVVDGETGATVT